MSNDLRIEIEQLKAKNNQLQKIIDNLDINIYWKDLDGKMLGMNKKNLTSLGFDNIDDVLNKKDHEFDVWNKTSDNLGFNDQQVIEAGETRTFEETYDLNGEKIVLLSTKSCLKDDEGRIVGIIGASVDISKEFRLARDMREKIKELEVKDKIIMNAKNAFMDALIEMS